MMKPMQQFGIALVGWALLGAGGELASRPAALAPDPARPHGGVQPLTVTSPGGDLVVSIGVEPRVTWAVSWKGSQVLRPSPLALRLDDGRTLGDRPVVVGTTTRRVDQLLRPVVRYKRAVVRDRFEERRIDFAGNYSLLVRAYDDGVAYRWETRLPGEITVVDEDATLLFSAEGLVYFPEETSLLSHQERLYKKLRLSEITAGRFSSLPALVALPDGPKVVITEADLADYPGMDLTAGPDQRSLRGLFPAYPLRVELVRDRNERVVERANYIARTRGARPFPWRVLVVAEQDTVLLDTDIVYRLAAETTLADTSWIRPGKVAWDWWNHNNVYGVPFKAGVNTDTYKYYIDFAANHGIEYVILDEGWYQLGNLLAVSPGMDMDALAAHARSRNVGLILWVVWKTFDEQMTQALDRFVQWDVKGIKVDFMQREDQWMVNFYERVAREAARRHLIVDFHGAYKPTGLYRTWPNVLTSEGVVGLEHNKWSEDASPDNAVTFPFLRMLAGPVDYTPGAMINAVRADFRPINGRPMSQGTRCHQLAMYVVYESPLQMLADSPSNYLREPESLAFLSKVPTVWDETVILGAEIGEYIVTARRSGRDWYIGALTSWKPRTVDIDLSPLGQGRFDAEIFRDGPNADRVGIDYVREVRQMSLPGRLAVQLAPGGGFAAHLRSTARQ